MMKKFSIALVCFSLLAACGQHRCHQMDVSSHPVKPFSAVLDKRFNFDSQSLHFDYRVKSDGVSWAPIRIFDDGKKTYIQMPEVVDVLDLPVIYAQRNHKRQLINHRYLKPYFIIDGLVESAVLLTGKGSSERVVHIRHCQSLRA